MFKLIDNTNKEEWANAFTHGLGVVFSYLGLVALMLKTLKIDDYISFAAVSVYGFSMIFLFTASTVYHLAANYSWKLRLQKIDHIAIYLLIAGTYTPLTIILFKDHGGIYIFGFVWLISILGSVLKLVGHKENKLLSTLIYLFLGWSILIRADILIWHLPVEVLIWLLLGGFFYTIGVIFFVYEKLRYSHAIWHLFVLAGCFSHYYLIYNYVVVK